MELDVEIETANYNADTKTVEITAIDTSQRRLDYLERNRIDQEFPYLMNFVIPLDSKKGYWYFAHWINSLKCVQKADAKLPRRISIGEALYSTIGCNCCLSSKYRVYE